MAKQNHIFTKIRTGSQAEMLAERLTRRQGENTGRRISTVAALAAAGMGLRISCPACGADEHIQGDAMTARFGEETVLKDLRDPCACGSAILNRMPVAMRH